LPLGADEYDPLRLSNEDDVQTTDVTIRDAARDGEIPARVYLPPAGETPQAPAPVVLFSHGLGGNRQGSSYLGRHWAARGYVAVFVQHPGSDDSVWKDEPLAKRMAAMQQAASLQNFLLRVQDVPAVLDQLAKWNVESGHALAGRLDLTRVGMSGHSFGAQTTQAVSGQSLEVGGQRFIDARIKAALVLSPGRPRRGDVNAAFGRVKIPWLLMTGTKDTAPIGGQTVESRLAVFPALPPGDKYELVLHNAEHSAFTARALPGDTEPRNPNHHRAILALSTAFWDACLRGDGAAKTWLDGSGPRSVLEAQDRWQRK
jgi:predicted dienelactone hydrolase